MGQLPRSKPTRFRRAVAGSVAVHLLLVSVGSVAYHAGTAAKLERAKQPSVDTRADEPTVRLLPEEVAIAVPIREPIKPTEPGPPEPEPLPTPTAPIASQTQPQAESTSGSRPTVKSIVPNALPSEMAAIIRRPRPAPSRITDPNVKPASAVVTSTPLAPSIHGAMKAGQTVVYVLDCSGSMGEFGKLTLARAALVSTLRRQPTEVRFQVLAYNGTARSVLPGLCVAASATNVAAAEAGLANLRATGRSNHVEAVRAAAALRPDVIVLLTDADDLTLAAFKSALAGVGKSVPVCVARVSADGVGAPRELK